NHLVGRHKSLAERFCDKVDVPEDRRFLGFDAYKKAIDSLDPGDVAILTTHAAFRPLHFEYAANKGVNVFMEKSFAPDTPATKRMMAANKIAKEKNLKVAVGFMWRHSAKRQEVIRRIHDGQIGDLHTLRIYRMHGPCHTPPLPEGAHELKFQLGRGVRFNWLSSGFFVDWHCHNVDVACWAKGDWPVSAQAVAGQTDRAAGNLLDHYSIEFTFEDGAKLFAYTRHMNGCWGTYSDYAHGTKGAAVLMTNLSHPKTRIYSAQNMAPESLAWRYEGGEKNPYDVEWQVLVDAIRSDTPHNEADRACKANVAALMGRMASQTGKNVTWDQAYDSTFQYVENIDAMTWDTPAPIQAGPDGRYSPPVPGVAKTM
ncbi:MAG: Gfo/Idh/MocA family oxidoreductase, partial [Pirellulaceae bacterium]